MTLLAPMSPQARTDVLRVMEMGCNEAKMHKQLNSLFAKGPMALVNAVVGSEKLTTHRCMSLGIAGCCRENAARSTEGATLVAKLPADLDQMECDLMVIEEDAVSLLNSMVRCPPCGPACWLWPLPASQSCRCRMLLWTPHKPDMEGSTLGICLQLQVVLHATG